MKRPDLPAEHCANQTPEQAKRCLCKALLLISRAGALTPDAPFLSSKSGESATQRYLLTGKRYDLLEQIGPGKQHQSVRSAAIEAGIIKPFPSLQLKDPSPTAQKLLAKKGKNGTWSCWKNSPALS